MPFIELTPGKAGENAIKMSQRKSGALIASFTAAVARRTGVCSVGKLRVLVDLESRPRVLRMIVDPAGTFTVRNTKGGAGVVEIGKLQGLERIRFDKAICEFVEDEDGDGRVMIDVTLPDALQASSVPQKRAEIEREDRVPTLADQIANAEASTWRKPSVSAARNGARR